MVQGVGYLLDPESRDFVIRTLFGEAATDPASQAAVAHVIRNRDVKAPGTAKDVVLAKNQFEPWGSRKDELLGLDQNSAIYQALGKVVDDVWSGTTPDPTKGATMFYAPKTQADLGRKAPAWDDGTGVDIGQHRFFGGDFPTPAPVDVTASLGAPPAIAPQSLPRMMFPQLQGISNLAIPQLAAAAEPAPTPPPMVSTLSQANAMLTALKAAGTSPQLLQIIAGLQNGQG